MIESNLLWIEYIRGPRTLNNLFWAFTLLFGGLSFLLVGLSSYIDQQIIPFLSFQSITFAPQGLVMCFYGIGSIFFSLSLWAAIIWNIGKGYNEFDKKEGIISLFRWGYPGKNRRIRIRFLIKDVQVIILNSNPNLRRTFFFTVKLKGKDQKISMPITELTDLREIEEKAAQLSRFLQIPIEGL